MTQAACFFLDYDLSSRESRVIFARHHDLVDLTSTYFCIVNNCIYFDTFYTKVESASGCPAHRQILMTPDFGSFGHSHSDQGRSGVKLLVSFH